MDIISETTPIRPSRRVAAWIYTVMNPLIDATRSEEHLLERGNLSWRYYSRRAEYFRRISECIEPHNAPNLEDFLADNEQFAPKFDQHDKALQLSEQKAAVFFDAVASAQSFVAEMNAALQEYEAILNASQPYNPTWNSMRSNLPNYVAEYLINNIHSLPSTHTTHKFWQLFGQRFQPYKDRESFQELQKAVKDLREASSDLRHSLENHRLQLCREFDLPAAAPVAQPSVLDARTW